ncbi:MAG: YggS family pyridoxal phosphate-dependent enzyme [Treponema sp.]|jgi:pyridoxal phosphate enzyme (YggS family)|nr:YggS family pyridoxal phosphate-dependent enzyme [Treponema sp.]
MVSDSVQRIREQIVQTCVRCGRDPATVQLMAVSKFQPIEKIHEAACAGIKLFGENRVQEAVQKLQTFKREQADIKIHLIGSLQRNKAKAALSFFDGIQSVDRESLLVELGRLTLNRAEAFPLLLELHTGEESKAGFKDCDSLLRAVDLASHYSGIAIRGLMTIAPFTQDIQIIRASFRSLVHAQQVLQSHVPAGDYSILSMGMSNDFVCAIEEGSTLIRIGTALFGSR